jgi:copper resistance protein B
MNTTTRLTTVLVLALASTFTMFAKAQDTVKDTDMHGVHMPESKSKPSQPKHKPNALAPATASSPAKSSGVHGMDMSSMHDMPMQQQPAKASVPPTPVTSSSSGQSMHGMDMQGMHVAPQSHQGQTTEQDMASMPGMQGMPMQAKPSADMQHLHFGQMIGTRPKPGGLAGAMDGMAMPSMQGMDMSSMQGGDAPQDARSSDYSDGYAYGSMPGMDMNDNPSIGMLLLDRLEYVHSRDGGNAMAIDGQAWYGKNFNKLWVKFEGEQADGKLQDLRTEALWDHAIATYWSTQIGVRHDFGVGPGRTWAAFGIEGLAPYWFETEATFYVGPDGRTAARASFEYEALLTQRLILQPELEVNAYGKDDLRRGIGSGLSDAEVGLRLRYEIRREFAPYIGVVWHQRFGRTADLARAQGEHADDLQFVAGFRIWY